MVLKNLETLYIGGWILTDHIWWVRESILNMRNTYGTCGFISLMDVPDFDNAWDKNGERRIQEVIIARIVYCINCVR